MQRELVSSLADANTSLARRFVEGQNLRSYLAVQNELLVPGAVIHLTVPGFAGPLDADAYKHYVAMVCTALPDRQISVHDSVAEAERVMLCWSATGTHIGADLLGFGPNGRRVTITGMSLFRFWNGLIVEFWEQADVFGLLCQLGFLPAPTRPEDFAARLKRVTTLLAPIPQVTADQFRAITCNRCGACCEDLPAKESPAEMAALIAGGAIDPDYRTFLSGLVPLEPTLDGSWRYRCRHFRRDAEGLGLCGIYETRPTVCRDFPAGSSVRRWIQCAWYVQIVDADGAPIALAPEQSSA